MQIRQLLLCQAQKIENPQAQAAGRCIELDRVIMKH
jgi:hypothetical protein